MLAIGKTELICLPITPSPHHPITPSPHHPISPSPHLPTLPTPYSLLPAPCSL
ncbi:hypothetical protein BJP36_36050 [Moorena producens JHB]|uniref:Uncharacterized protein n=1 Tax=Moorena producens (strain JHB) TaxID=1454205 RepID=A0A9Q9STT3_MOOP1|nr:hypothetical protein [Moorena producens]WAN69508.1 hypothetical protein BJP36_36050 [Moorena producens JHB]